MNYVLKDHFPMIRDREDILADIRKNWKLSQTYAGWEEKQRQEFLDICTGVKGVKMTYDPFFKEVMNPEYAPERLSDFLSVVLGQEVKVLKILPNDSVRITAESTLLITDIVVELIDGSVANVEMQKIGYAFPGERAACYSADLLLRQYKRVKGNKDKMNYRDIKPVYTIILFENSPKEFKEFKDIYLHHVTPQSDTGLKINLLQNYLFIPLDIFCENMHNEPITSRIEAWLTFFSAEKPEDVLKLIEAYPEFKPMYEEVYALCKNTEKVIDMFSEELYELDKNTVKFMMDEMQEEIDGLKEQVTQKDDVIAEKDDVIAEKDNMIAEKDNMIAEKDDVLAEKDDMIAEKDDVIAEKDDMIAEKDNMIAEKDNIIATLQQQLQRMKVQ
jgi:hypothetical protein